MAVVTHGGNVGGTDFSSYFGRPGYHKVNPVHVAALREIHFKRHWPSLARETLLQKLTAADFNFRIGDSDVAGSEVTPLFRELLNQHYKPFVRDCYDELMVVGIAMVRIIKDKTNNMVPAVVSSAALGVLFDIYIHADPVTGHPVYELVKLKKRNGQPLPAGPTVDRKAFIVEGISPGPRVDGILQSRLASMFTLQLDFERALANFQHADYNLSNPAVVTELAPEAASGLSPSEGDQDIYTPNDDFMANLEGLYARDRESSVHVREHVNGQINSMGRWTPDAPRVQSYIYDNVISLPHGHRPAAVPRPDRRSDMAVLNDQYQTGVSATYGIPRAYMVQDTSFRTSGASQLVNDHIQQTLSQWSETMSRILTSVMRCIYLKNDCNFIFGIMPRSKKPMTLEELYSKAEGISRISVTLPISPTKDMRANLALLYQGLITRSEYAAHMRTISGYPPHEITHGPMVSDKSDAEDSPEFRAFILEAATLLPSATG